MEDWKELCLAREELNEKYKKVLLEGPKSFSQALFLSAMRRKYQTPGSNK
jgi:hypothetical protein